MNGLLKAGPHLFSLSDLSAISTAVAPPRAGQYALSFLVSSTWLDTYFKSTAERDEAERNAHVHWRRHLGVLPEKAIETPPDEETTI